KMLDFVVDVDGGIRARVVSTAPTGGFSIRGLGATIVGGRNSYEVFGGATLPWFAAARQIAGINVSRQQTDRVYVDGTTAMVTAPLLTDGQVVDHQSSLFQTVGVTDRICERAAVQARVGGGTTGFLAQGSTTWQADRLAAFLTATGSSPRFGLNQLQLV